MMLGSYLVLVVAAAVAVALFTYWLFKRRELRHILPVITAMLVAGLITGIAYPQYASLSGFLASSVAVAAISSMLPMLYRKRPLAFMLVIFLLAYAAAISLSRVAAVGMFGVGTIIGALYTERYLASRREDRSMRKTKTEQERDMIQMLIGLLVLCVMLVWQMSYVYILFWAVVLAYLFNSLISKGGKAYRLLSRFERRDVEYGIGAIHLAAGLAILLGFASFKLALFGVFPLFFSDALATLTGMRFYRSNRLPHNRAKSVAGTAAFFIATVVPGFLLLGLWGIPIAIVLTIVESLKLPIDDNVSVPIVTVILGALAGI